MCLANFYASRIEIYGHLVFGQSVYNSVRLSVAEMINIGCSYSTICEITFMFSMHTLQLNLVTFTFNVLF